MLPTDYYSTVAALLAAHAVADFVLQGGRMVESKRQWPMLNAHMGVVYLCSALMLGSLVNPLALSVALVHGAVDAIKCRVRHPGITPFLIDQWLHGLTIALMPLLLAQGAFSMATTGLPLAWQHGLSTMLPPIYVVVFGLVMSTRGGLFAVELLMREMTQPPGDDTLPGLPGGGRMIGVIERGLVWLLVMVGQFTAIGWLLGAKSILRFGAVKEDRAASEYVIIGTLASHAWAIVIALVTSVLLQRVT
ncbi:DUF3307 domain-containing protein [Gammaproteobacteria bacterium]|nr:DUF3307 domain-containing protein [Gammaproteobacteria bacterium]